VSRSILRHIEKLSQLNTVQLAFNALKGTFANHKGGRCAVNGWHLQNCQMIVRREFF
jgi:hypothetical protein